MSCSDCGRLCVKVTNVDAKWFCDECLIEAIKKKALGMNALWFDIIRGGNLSR